MIILLQGVAMQFRRLFRHISYYKVRQSDLSQSMTDCYYKVRQVLQSMADFITNCVRYYKCDSYYKVRRNTCRTLNS